MAYDPNDLEKIDHLILDHVKSVGLMDWKDAFATDIMNMIQGGRKAVGPLLSIPAVDLLQVIYERLESGLLTDHLKEVTLSRPGYKKTYLVPLDTTVEVG